MLGRFVLVGQLALKTEPSLFMLHLNVVNEQEGWLVSYCGANSNQHF